ncbi:uncharacterized protein LOC132545252 [Ylistrum balloti]|uniref:uncharacterized protein LOC132545252 n=1 Tax=Ylistrum balloti TaxID=509963 RepID=UPI0029058A4D|nr:uncharacterized protein LOC132545252 [Ylistrum balloti]
MAVYIALMMLAVAVIGCSGQSNSTPYCRFISQVSCQSKGRNNLCGTDGITYQNTCYLLKARCLKSTVQVAHSGPCPTSSSVLTGMGVVSISNIALDVFCLDLFKHSCDSEERQNVCGTDGTTYVNLYIFVHNLCFLTDCFEMDSTESERLSVLLSTYLDRYCTGTKDDVDIRQKTQIVMEQAFQYSNVEIQRFYGGSRAEGFYLANSDYDRMLIDKTVEVLIQPRQYFPTKTRQTFLYMRDSDCRPGYVNFMLRQLGEVPSDPLLNSLVETEDGYFVSSDIYREQLVSAMTAKVGSLFKSNGPSCTTNSSSYNADVVFCFPCKGWPTAAQEWVTRTRQYGWPHQTLIDRIVRDGCHVVPVGDKTLDTLLHWRISFISAERMLVHSFSHIQFKVYFLLKYFLQQLKVTLKQMIGDDDILCSYFLKTVLFHAIENSKDTLWQDKNIFNCFWLCFNILIAWVKAGYCPNYFIPTNNMFLRKIHGHHQQRLVEILNHYQRLKWGCLKVGHFFRPTIMDYLCHQPIQDKLVQPEPVSEVVLRRDQSIVQYLRTLHFPERRSLKIVLGMFNLLLKSTSEYDEVLSYYYAMHVLYDLSIEHAYPNHTTAIGNKTRYRSLKKAKHWIIPRTSIGTEVLYLATFFFRMGNFQKALEITRQVIDLASHFWDEKETMTPEHEAEYIEGYCGSESPFIFKLRKLFTACISFEFEQKHFCLPHLRPEISQQHVKLLIPPLPYAIFLSFMCNHELKDINERDRALRELLIVKYGGMQGGQKYWIVHNLLGICYETLGDIQKAIKSYEKSAQMKTDIYELNPAKERMDALRQRC